MDGSLIYLQFTECIIQDTVGEQNNNMRVIKFSRSNGMRQFGWPTITYTGQQCYDIYCRPNVIATLTEDRDYMCDSPSQHLTYNKINMNFYIIMCTKFIEKNTCTQLIALINAYDRNFVFECVGLLVSVNNLNSRCLLRHIYICLTLSYLL